MPKHTRKIVISEDNGAGTRRAIRIAARRISPSFLICDRHLGIVLRSPELELEGMLEPSLVERIIESLQRTAAERAGGGLVFEPIDEETVLRMVPLAGAEAGSTAVFIERIEDRGSVSSAARQYGLTRREQEVLGLVIRSRTSGQVADALSIAEATVVDHIKNVMRKMRCSKRSELIARVYNLDYEPGPEVAAP